MELKEILAQRGSQYGDWTTQAAVAQALKGVALGHAQRHNVVLSDVQAESLDMILHKISRIVNGNPNNIDSWEDIGGYAKLVVDRLKAAEDLAVHNLKSANAEVEPTSEEEEAFKGIEAAPKEPWFGLENAYDKKVSK